METLQIGATTKKVPSTWNELRRRQLLDLLPIFYGPREADRRLRLLSVVTGFRLPLLAGLPVEVLAQLLPLVDFLESDDHLLTEQLLPTLLVPGRHHTELPVTFHGPTAWLSNLTFGEFIFADTFFVQYSLRPRSEHLDKFLAVLYRPGKRNPNAEATDWDGDQRVPFNEHHLALRAPRLARVNNLEKLAILTWYRGCRAQLGEEFPDVFAEAEKSAAPQTAPDWAQVLRKLAGGAFGAVKETAGQPLRLLLAEMQDAAVDYQRQKSQNPS